MPAAAAQPGPASDSTALSTKRQAPASKAVNQISDNSFAPNRIKYGLRASRISRSHDLHPEIPIRGYSAPSSASITGNPSQESHAAIGRFSGKRGSMRQAIESSSG